MGTFLVSAVNIALPAIGRDLTLNAVRLSWVVTAFILAMALFTLPAGSWGDRSDNRRLFKLGVILFTLSSAICYVSPDGYRLIGARFLQGVGAALTGPTGQAILVSAFPAERRGQALGISVASVYGGLALGPLVGGIVTLHAGWRILFLIAVLLGLLSLLVSYLFLKGGGGRRNSAGRGDVTGTLLFMAGLAALVYGSSLIPAVAGWALMGAGVALLLLFWRCERRARRPMLDTRLFSHNRLFARSALSALINYTATFAIIFFLSLYLQKVQGLSARDAGAIIVAQPAMMALFSPVVGKLSDRIQPRYLATAGMAMCTAGLGMFSLLGPATDVRIIIAILLWVGLGFALFSSPNMNTIMSSVDRRQYGQASGLASSMRVFGQIISMSIVTLLFSLLFGDRSIEEVPDPLFLRAMRWSFIIFTLTGLPGIILSFSRGNLKGRG
jgi:EmrB/QacA subfamily drug resistance transporter